MSRRGSCGENNFGALSRRIAAGNEPQNVFSWPGDRPFRRGRAANDCSPVAEDSAVVTLVCEWDYAPATDPQDNGTGTQDAGLLPVVPADTDDMRPMSALISIGCGGITRVRECDVGRGFRLVTPASTLKVDILYPILASDEQVPVTQPAAVFTTWIGRGTVPASGAFAPMRKTIHYGVIQNAAETVFPIPAGALAAVVFSSKGNTATNVRQRLGSTPASGVVSQTNLLAADARQQDNAIVLVQGATHLGLVNVGGEGSDVYGVLYLLTL